MTLTIKSAEEIVKQFKDSQYIFDNVHPNAKAYFLSEGFLDLVKRVDPIVEALKSARLFLNEGVCYGDLNETARKVDAVLSTWEEIQGNSLTKK